MFSKSPLFRGKVFVLPVSSLGDVVDMKLGQLDHISIPFYRNHVDQVIDSRQKITKAFTKRNDLMVHLWFWV